MTCGRAAGADAPCATVEASDSMYAAKEGLAGAGAGVGADAELASEETAAEPEEEEEEEDAGAAVSSGFAADEAALPNASHPPSSAPIPLLAGAIEVVAGGCAGAVFAASALVLSSKASQASDEGWVAGNREVLWDVWPEEEVDAVGQLVVPPPPTAAVAADIEEDEGKADGAGGRTGSLKASHASAC